jgi:hypothetical protein
LADGRHTPTSSSDLDLRVLIGGGVAILVVLGVVGYLVFGRSKGDTDNQGVQISASGAGFQFRDAKAFGISVDPKADRKKANAAAVPIAQDVAGALNTLYGEGFLDPANTQKGTYDNALAVFDAGSLSEAQSQVDVLTAGASAGSTFDSIGDGTGHLKVQVLLDKSYRPQSAVGIVTFTATAKGKDGSTIAMRSQGQFIFRDVEGTWKIVSFNVTRNDQSGTSTATSSGSASP